jgi:hypothetical protein
MSDELSDSVRCCGITGVLFWVKFSPSDASDLSVYCVPLRNFVDTAWCSRSANRSDAVLLSLDASAAAASGDNSLSSCRSTKPLFLRWRSWLRHCAANRKVAGSISYGVTGIFHWHNPSVWQFLTTYNMWCSSLRVCATSRKVTVSIPDGIIQIFHPLNPGVDSASNRNKYQEYCLGCRGGRCLGLTTLPPPCADCPEIWELQSPGKFRACPGLYRDCFTFYLPWFWP